MHRVTSPALGLVAPCIFLLCFQRSGAVQLLSNSTVPQNLTADCTSALLADVSCDPVVSYLKAGSYYPESTLNRTCTTNCEAALAGYEAKIASSCSAQTWSGYDDAEMPLTVIADLIRYEYNLSCITDSGRFCNNVAAQAAYAADPEGGDPVTGSSFASDNTTDAPNSVDACDLCLIKNLQFQAGSPYYNGPELASESIYQSKVSSCKVTGHPLTATSTFSFYSPTSSATPTSSVCAGKSYTIQTGDDCYSISKSQGIGTGWLLVDNGLDAYCANFPANGTLCLQDTCNVYTVRANDTCSGTASAFNITVPQLISWNPVINPGCYNLGRLNGSQLCVSAPGTPYTAPNLTSLAPLTPTAAAPVPTDVAEGTNTRCGTYYMAVPGDYCNLIVLKFGISLDDFTFLNPAINDNCTNLYANEDYCVQAVGDINTYSGRPGYMTATSVATASFTPYSDLPTATSDANATFATGLPLASGTRADCNFYFNGSNFQGPVSFYSSQCELAAVVYNVDLDAFGTWNQGLNVSDASCSFQTSVAYCGKLYFGDQPPAIAPSMGYPTRDNTTADCTDFADAYDGRTCQDILDTYDLTIAQFYAYNPAVGSDCSNLWAEYSYCVRTPDYIDETSPSGTNTSAGTPTSSSSPTPTSPTQSGEPTNCNKWYTAQSGDSCSSVADACFITLDQFHSWNPAVNNDCSTGFWSGYAYCVGTTDTATQSRSSVPAPSSTSSGVAAPTPTQANNAVSNCDSYAEAQSGDSCSLFADRNQISAESLYAWNSVLGSDGSGCSNMFWAGYYYCVGVSG